ncbi:hypothetical protein ES705_34447 [subsurface metagenome]
MYDSLYSVWSELSAISNEGSIEIMAWHLNKNMEHLATAEQNLRVIAKSQAKDRKELFRFINAANMANRVFYVIWEEKAFKLYRKLEKLDEKIINTRKLRWSSYGSLFHDEIKTDLPELEKAQKDLRDLLVKRVKEFPKYISEIKDSLREAGWSQYLEWRKFNKDVEPTGEINGF